MAGKHVFCEKCLVFKPEEVHALRALRGGASQADPADRTAAPLQLLLPDREADGGQGHSGQRAPHSRAVAPHANLAAQKLKQYDYALAIEHFLKQP